MPAGEFTLYRVHGQRLVIVKIIFKPWLKNTRRWSKKIEEIVVAGMNTNPGGVLT